MIEAITIGGYEYRYDAAQPLDISIPMYFGGPQPNVYGVESAAAEACSYGDLVGDTRRGGSCNFERVTLITHCNGTHTECVGHITDERIFVRSCLRDVFLTARLVSVQPVSPGETSDSYPFPTNATDLIITRSSVSSAVSGAPINSTGKFDALIVRTLPNGEEKLSREYGTAPFFSAEAAEFIVAAGFRHLLVDLPSIDRLRDGGKLSNHRIFWNVEADAFTARPATRVGSTITELIYVAESIIDGGYLLNLQIAPFAADAAPSRPILFALV